MVLSCLLRRSTRPDVTTTGVYEGGFWKKDAMPFCFIGRVAGAGGAAPAATPLANPMGSRKVCCPAALEPVSAATDAGGATVAPNAAAAKALAARSCGVLNAPGRTGGAGGAGAPRGILDAAPMVAIGAACISGAACVCIGGAVRACISGAACACISDAACACISDAARACISGADACAIVSGACASGGAACATTGGPTTGGATTGGARTAGAGAACVVGTACACGVPVPSCLLSSCEALVVLRKY